jgi:glycosyltransferase involved in cell wall biosynthesis
MIKLSIIIPVFNTEQYISTCLNSLKNQIDHNVEIIIINDGSNDNSINIINTFIDTLPYEKKSHFFIINQKNSGVSNARNNGIKYSTGKYITFIDADDFVSETYISDIFDCIKYNPDLIQFNANCYFESNHKNNHILQKYSDHGYQILDQNLKTKLFNDNMWFSWLRVYKKECFDNILFPEHISHFEDAYIISEIILRSQSIFILNKPLYNYRIDLHSATRSSNIQTKQKLLKSAESIIQHLISNCSKDIIYAIPLMHFFSIYINETKLIQDKRLLKDHWNKFSQQIYQLHIPSKIIYNQKERYLLYFLLFGPFLGQYLAKKLLKLMKPKK